LLAESVPEVRQDVNSHGGVNKQLPFSWDLNSVRYGTWFIKAYWSRDAPTV
jgi:hypothetical protein